MIKILTTTIWFIFTICLIGQTTTIEIDFGSQFDAKNMSGILHGVHADKWDVWYDTTPEDSLLINLRPKFWRIATGDEFFYDYIKYLDDQTEVIVNDIYYPYTELDIQPYEDSINFVEAIDKFCERTKDRDYVYEIWNEPDIDFFWPGTEDQFFETFKIAHDRIRQNIGSHAIISGPSVAHFDTSYIRRFCDYSLSNSLEINDFSFHWLGPDIRNVANAINWVREEFAESPKYKPLNIDRIVVNEIVGPGYQYKPGAAIAHFKYLELGNADGACKACWDSEDGTETFNCWNNTVDGLLTTNELKPRSVWWAHKLYADLDKTRFSVNESENIFGLAGISLDGGLRIFAGSYTFDNSQEKIQTSIDLSNITKQNTISSESDVEFIIYKVPNTEFEQLERPILVSTDTTILSNIPSPQIDIGPNELIIIDIRSLEQTTSTKDLISEAITIFPNPTQNNISIDFARIKEYNVYISDLNGRLFFQGSYDNSKETTINLENLNKGIYFLNIYDSLNNLVKTQSIVVQ